MDMQRNVLRVLRVCMGSNHIRKRNAEKDCWSPVMKESCAWQILGFIKQTKGKLLM